MSSISSLVLAPLASLENSLNALTASLTTSQSLAAAPAASADLLAADDALTSALTLLKRHQDNCARIATLQDEAYRLQDQIRSIVRTCGELRAEVGEINPGILEDSDSEEDEEGSKIQDVDYKTLLAFAARIGKHNAVAERQAEQDATKRKIEVHKQESEKSPLTNGNGNVTGANGQTGAEKDIVELPEEAQADLNFLNSQVAAERAVKGWAFPDAAILRNGALGQLQLAREAGGEEAVDMEVERWIKEAEGTGPDAPQGPDVETEQAAPTTDRSQPARTQQRPHKAVAAPVQTQKKLNLDLWDEGSDDDD